MLALVFSLASGGGWALQHRINLEGSILPETQQIPFM